MRYKKTQQGSSMNSRINFKKENFAEEMEMMKERTKQNFWS